MTLQSMRKRNELLGAYAFRSQLIYASAVSFRVRTTLLTTPEPTPIIRITRTFILV